MKRRAFITLLGGAAAAWPHAARGQRLPIIGLLSMGASPADPANFRPFLEQMRALGYIDGQNIIFDRRFAAGDDSLLGSFVADLVRRPVDIIVATGTREVIAGRRATSSIPIVTFIHPDPIGMGLAQSLARPGGNVTGLTTMDVELYGKRTEILKQAVPNLRKTGVLISGRQPQYRRDSPWARNFETAARSLAVELDIVEADESNLDSALAALAARGAQGLVVTSDGVYVAHGKALAEGAIKHRLPAIFVFTRRLGGDVDAERTDDAAVLDQNVGERQIIDDAHPVLLGSAGERLLLIAAGVFEPDAGTTREGVSAKRPVAVGRHVDAPVAPIPDPIAGLFEELARQRNVVEAADLALQKLPQDGLHVVPVLLGDVAHEMVVDP